MGQESRIILDVSGGGDDALAVLFALKSSRAKLEGITTVFGPVTAEQATMNMLQVTELIRAEIDVPVVTGAIQPLFREWNGRVVGNQGVNGLGDYILPATKREPLQEHAADFMVRMVRDNPGQITIVTTGSLTNIALALSRDPHFASKIHRLVIRGGSLQAPGNVTPVAEENIYRDPEAAHRVFESGIPITMVSLDVTMQAILTEGHLTELITRGRTMACPLKNPDGAVLQKRMMKFIEHVTDYQLSIESQEFDRIGIPLHGPLAVEAALDPSVLDTRPVYIQIETKGTRSIGATLADLRRAPNRVNADVCVSFDIDRFIGHFIDVLSSMNREGLS